MSASVSFLSQSPTPPETAARFGDLHPAFDKQAAVPEANRCLFCFDAPCMQACPTHIDVPRFIKKIANDNLRGSAQTILEANVLGASCSRACPVEVLCEGACVLHRYNREPIQIGCCSAMRWMRFMRRRTQRAVSAGGGDREASGADRRGAGVAGVRGGAAAAWGRGDDLRRAAAARGLNTYGIAEYKLPLSESLREIDMIARLGVEFRFGRGGGCGAACGAGERRTMRCFWG